MKAAAAVPVLSGNIEENIRKIHSMINEAADNGAALVLFPETVLTALSISDVYEEDKNLAVSINSDTVRGICTLAKNRAVWVALGFLELDEDMIYDSAMLINSNGEIVLRYKRISHGWLAPDAKPAEYGCGSEVKLADTPWGKTGFLICGDLFDIERPFPETPDLLLFPFARCFSPGITDPQKQWDELEWPDYSERLRSVGATALMANYIAPEGLNGGGFGGAFATDKNGGLLAALPLYKEGILFCEI